MTRVQVSTAHPDHYLKPVAWSGGTVVWWDGFTGLTLVVTQMESGLTRAVGAGLLVSVIDRRSEQTFAWAFHADSSAAYIAEKIPAGMFSQTWRTRLAQSIQVALRLHARLTGHATPTEPEAANRCAKEVQS